MKISYYFKLFLIILVVGSIIQIISQGLVAINEEKNGKKCIEYNKNAWGNESIRRGCKTWA
jgi:hypothetical protein